MIFYILIFQLLYYNNVLCIDNNKEISCKKYYNSESTNGVNVGWIYIPPVKSEVINTTVEFFKQSSEQLFNESNILLYANNKSAAMQIRKNLPTVYTVHSTLQKPPAKLARIIVNGHTICQAKKYSSTAATFNLTHSLNISSTKTISKHRQTRQADNSFPLLTNFFNSNQQKSGTNWPESGSHDALFKQFEGIFNSFKQSKDNIHEIEWPKNDEESDDNIDSILNRQNLQNFDPKQGKYNVTTYSSHKYSIIRNDEPEPGSEVLESDVPEPEPNTYVRTIEKTNSPFVEFENNDRRPTEISKASTTASACGKENTQHFKSYIVNGYDIQPSQFPWLAAIFMQLYGSWDFECGGSLISRRTVLTAAHCFLERRSTVNPDMVFVLLGSHNIYDRKNPGVSLNVQEILTHPGYSKKLKADADLALIFLEQTVTLNERIHPICLWTGQEDLNAIVGQNAVIAGWGRDENLETSDVPKMLKVPIISTKNCQDHEPHYKVITTDRTICAGSLDGRGPCMGDSGGPLMIKSNNNWMLRGVVSIGPTNCKLKEYSVYTDLAKFRQWIIDNMNE